MLNDQNQREKTFKKFSQRLSNKILLVTRRKNTYKYNLTRDCSASSYIHRMVKKCWFFSFELYPLVDGLFS